MQWPSLSVRVAYTQAALRYSLTENEDAAVAMSESNIHGAQIAILHSALVRYKELKNAVIIDRQAA